jgi:pimeloyl-ACP methyl ester carboxylesterase
VDRLKCRLQQLYHEANWWFAVFSSLAFMVACSSRIKLSVGQIFWREAGDTRLPTIIFLHGSWHDSTQWDKVVSSLSRNFHCLAIDLLGYGNSTALEMPTSIEMEVDALHEFVSTLNLHSVYLVGHSLGAWVALRYTLKFPDRVLGVVAISPVGAAVPNWQQYGRSTTWLLSQPWLFTIWLRSLQILTSLGDGADPLAKSQAYWRFFAKFPTTRKLLFERSTVEISRELVVDRLAKFRQPLLVLHNNNDDRYMLEQSRNCARAVRNSQFKLMGQVNFTSPQELTESVAIEIRDFFNSVQAQIDRAEVGLW